MSGLRVVVTRATHQAEELARPLRELGAAVILLPMLEIAGPEDPLPLHEAAANPDRYDWIIFTSTNAVEAFAAVMPPDSSCKAKIATIGVATRRACERYGFTVQLTPLKYIAESLVAAFQDENLSGKLVLIPSAAVTRDVIPPALRKLGASVDVVEAYRNMLPPETEARVNDLLTGTYPDWVLFASSSAVTSLVNVAGVERVNGMRVASIGPATTATAQSLGVQVTVEAQTHDVAGLIDAVASFARAD